MWRHSFASEGAITVRLGTRAQVGVVEGAVVRGAVAAHQAAAVEREQHRQVLDRDVVDQLVVAALQERRIDRHHRLHALAGEPGGEGHGVLLGDADVEVALREVARRTRTMPEPSRIAGVIATRRGSCAAMSQSQSPNTCE